MTFGSPNKTCYLGLFVTMGSTETKIKRILSCLKNHNAHEHNLGHFRSRPGGNSQVLWDNAVASFGEHLTDGGVHDLISLWIVGLFNLIRFLVNVCVHVHSLLFDLQIVFGSSTW